MPPESLAAVWKQIDYYYECGLNIIPIRDKDEVVKGVPKLRKSPYEYWTHFEKEINPKESLWKQMERHNTCAVGIIAGKISGNLEVIDIDVKYKPGIDARLFRDIQSFYPDLFKRLRAHKTPSGGYHILYRVPENSNGEQVPGNQKLAGYWPEGVKKTKKNIANFLETRGEGGYIAGPPSVGYSVHNNVPIPVISWAERCGLIELCKSYTEIVEVKKEFKGTKAQSAYYDETPQDHFNRASNEVKFLSSLGWTYCGAEMDNGDNMYFTRPGKDAGVSASFHKSIRLFYCFTSSTCLSLNTAYSLSMVLCEYNFEGDTKKTYDWLVEKGYGKVKPKIEEERVKSAAITGRQLPENFSKEAKVKLETVKAKMDEMHPYGVFWEYADDEFSRNQKMTISRFDLYRVAQEMGYCIYDGALFQIQKPFIYSRDDRNFYDTLKEYIKEEDADIYKDIYNCYEAFMQKNGEFTISRLPILDESMVLRDTRDCAFKFFRNGYTYITAEESDFFQYTGIEKLVFYDRVQQRDYILSKPDGVYPDFLKHALGEVSAHTKKVIGFLCHEYKDETTAYIIVCVESCPDPKMGGGSGKNVFCELLKYSTTYISKPGSQTKFDEKFFQTWNGQRIFAISDIPKDFDFTFLKEPSSGTFVWKKLFKDEVVVPVHKAPKFIVQTNFSYECSDGGLKRRIIPLEFTPFFTSAGGLDVHYNKHFPNDWSDEDWNGYDNFITECIQEWIICGRKLKPTELSRTGWEKQFIHTYGPVTHDFIVANWVGWLEVKEVRNEVFKTDFEKFCVENSINKNYWPSMTKINAALTEYAKHFNVVFKKDVSSKYNGSNTKIRVFDDGIGDMPDF